MNKDDLGTRMKTYYEQIPKTRLMRRTPVIIRIDGKAFHTFTRGFQKPFDEILIRSMQETMKYLCENIQGCVLGYTQSDEISLVLVDYNKLSSSAWFDYEIQKMCSIVASMATMAFNNAFRNHIGMLLTYLHYGEKFDYEMLQKEYCLTKEDLKIDSEFWNRFDKYQKVMGTAMFDARVFNIPKEEVTNYIYWRQLDASRNSIQMVGQANFSHKELQNKSCNMIQDMLFTQKGINWNDLPTYQKRGSCCIKQEYSESNSVRTHWIIDKDIPMFKNESRDYIDKLVYVGETDEK